MANNKNDKRILALRKQIEQKKNDLSLAGAKFSPITNCSLPMDGMNVNIHTMSRGTILLAIGDLQAKIDGLFKIFPDETLVVGQYSAEEWIQDLKQKYLTLNILEEKNKLASLEKKLNEMLSNDTKVGLELDDIENLLK